MSAFTVHGTHAREQCQADFLVISLFTQTLKIYLSVGNRNTYGQFLQLKAKLSHRHIIYTIMSHNVLSLDDELLLPSPELAAIVGSDPISRRDAVAQAHLVAFGSDDFFRDSSCSPLIASFTGQHRISRFHLAARVILNLH